jgi:hypothetical protein
MMDEEQIQKSLRYVYALGAVMFMGVLGWRLLIR